MIDFFQSIGGFIMTPLYYAISAVLVGWHNVFGEIFGPSSGIAWCRWTAGAGRCGMPMPCWQSSA